MQGRLGVRAGIGGTMLATGLLAAWLHWSVGGETVSLWVDDTVTVLAALAAAVLCVRAGVTHSGALRRFWWLLAGACASWTLAETIWGVYDLFLDGGVPVVSWADVGYLAALPLAIAALVSHPALRGGGTRKARSVVDGLTIATALLFLSWTLVLGPLWDSSDLSTTAGVVALAYPFGDVVIVFFVVLAVRRMTGVNRMSLWCLLGGLLALAVADSVYAYLAGIEDYASGGPLDAGWVAGYLGIALSALLADAGSVRIRHAEEPTATPLAPLVAPFLPLLLALGVLGIKTQLGDRPDGAGIAIAFALVALVLVRQLLMLRDLLVGDPQGDRDDDCDREPALQGAAR